MVMRIEKNRILRSRVAPPGGKTANITQNTRPMNRTLRLIPFHSPSDKGWREAASLYREAFPAKEIRSEADHLRALQEPRFEADGIWLEEEFAGLLYFWRFREWYYIEHLAGNPGLRGQQIGSRALEAFCRNRQVILEIDPPEDETSIRRLHFYQRLGFVENPQHYLHPSFQRPFETHRLVLLSSPRTIENDEARDFADFVRECVLRYSEHEHPVLPCLP